jgi:hypothetical protein
MDAREKHARRCNLRLIRHSPYDRLVLRLDCHHMPALARSTPDMAAENTQGLARVWSAQRKTCFPSAVTRAWAAVCGLAGTPIGLSGATAFWQASVGEKLWTRPAIVSAHPRRLRSAIRRAFAMIVSIGGAAGRRYNRKLSAIEASIARGPVPSGKDAA